MTPDELMRQAHLQDDVERTQREHAATREALAKCSAAYNRGRDRQAHLADALKAVLYICDQRLVMTSEEWDVVRAARRTLAETEAHHGA